jgi:hypothetical protein
VIPPGRGHRGDWEWWEWVAAAVVVVSVLAIIVGSVLLAV